MESKYYSNKFKELTSQLTKDILSYAGDPAKAIPKTLKDIKDITKAGIVALYRCNENFSGTKHVGHTLIAQVPEKDSELLDKELFDYLAQTIHSHKTVVSVAEDKGSEVQERLSKIGLRNSLLLPMQIENTIIGGFIILGLPSTDKLGQIIEGLQTLSGMFALTFRYSMLYTETKKQVNKKAQEKIERFSRIIEDSLNEIYLFDAGNLRFIQVNNSALTNLGFSMEELKTMTPLNIKPEITPESFAQLAKPLLKGKENEIVFETVHQRKDKSLYDVEVHLQLLRFEMGTPMFAAIILDVTKRKQTEKELKRYREKLEQLVKERTKELELKNEELNNAMKVFVGRELKIKELQNKLNALDK